MTPTKDEAKMSTYLIKNIPQTLYRVFSAKVKLNCETDRNVLIKYMEEYGK